MKHYGLFVALFAFFMPAAGVAGELEDRVAIRGQVYQMFMQEQFDELDELADQYRTAESRTESGLWKLTLFYTGIGAVADFSKKDQSYWESIEAKAQRWIEHNPKSPTAHIAYAMILFGRAWSLPGAGPGAPGGRESGKPFHDQVARARVYLLEHKDVAASDPRWYETMLAVARAENWNPERFSELVGEAVERYPYFYQIYFAAIDDIAHDQRDRRERLEAIANLAAEKTRERDGMGAYARVYWYAAQSQYGSRLFTDTAVVWAKMKSGIGDVLARYPDQWNLNNFARFACLAWDQGKTAELIQRVEPAPTPDAWQDRSQYEQCRTWALRAGAAVGKMSSRAADSGS